MESHAIRLIATYGRLLASNASLKTLLDRFEPSTIECAFSPTAKNGPLQEFFATILGRAPESAFEFSRHQFEVSCPALYARVEETTGATLNG